MFNLRKSFHMTATMVLGLIAAATLPAHAAIVTVPVGNGSFEIDNGFIPGAGVTAANANWWLLPDGVDWVDGNPGADYEILDLDKEGYHFPALDTAPDGIRVANLGAVSVLSQDLSFAIAGGDTITLSLWVGDSTRSTPGNLNVTFNIGGTDANTQMVTNTAPDGQFVQKSVQWTATGDGNLVIKLNRLGAVYIDDVQVSVAQVPEPASAAAGMLGLILLAARRRRRR